jgi:hypothetical protein
VREPYWRDATATLYAGDTREVLTEMPTGHVDCIVTSPPPWNPDGHAAADQSGPGLYVTWLRRVCAEAHRVLTDTGTLWLAVADRYTGTDLAGPPSGRHTRRVRAHTGSDQPAKSLVGLPWQIAFALQDDGWIIRNAIVTHHPDNAPKPVADRLASTYALIFLLVKQKRYHFDLDPIRQPPRRPEVAAEPPEVGGKKGAAGSLGASVRRRPGKRQTKRHGNGKYSTADGNCRRQHGAVMLPTGCRHVAAHASGKNPGDVWSLSQRPLPNAFPVDIPLRCIAAGCLPGGTVLDMFAGLATTGLAARHLGRSFIGIESDAVSCDLAKAVLLRDSGESAGEP